MVTLLPDLYIRLDRANVRADRGSCTPGKTIPCGNACRKPENCKTKNRVTEANKELRRSFADRMRAEKTKDRPFKQFPSNKFNELAQKSQDISERLKRSIEQTSIVDPSKGNNNIVKFGVRTQRNLLREMGLQLDELHELAEEFDLYKRDQKLKDEIKEAGKLLDEIKNTFKELQGTELDRAKAKLERSYKGLVDQMTARSAAISKRIYERWHPRKLVRMPKGSTQQDFVEAMDRLNVNDREAIKKYTVPRPPKSKKSKKSNKRKK